MTSCVASGMKIRVLRWRGESTCWRKWSFGDEEIKIVGPAIQTMQALGLNVTGPCPPDTVFMQCHEGMYDMVVAMYHDQGHIPLKLLGFYDGVNITAGLPFIRTSADHGTAFDIAGQVKPSLRAWRCPSS